MTQANRQECLLAGLRQKKNKFLALTLDIKILLFVIGDTGK
jgi:hypothetical protein